MHANIEKNIDNKTNSIDGLINKMKDSFESAQEIIDEGLPQIEAFCERNQLAMQMFCEKQIDCKKVENQNITIEKNNKV